MNVNFAPRATRGGRIIQKFFFGVIFICIFIVAIVYPCLFFFQLGVQRNSSRYIEEWFNVKENYAESIQTKK